MRGLADWDFLLLVLATWRLAHMLAVEDGPWDCFARWRRRVGAVRNVGGYWTADRSWPKLWICPLCLSVWIAPVIAVLYYSGEWQGWLVTVLAISGAASFLELLTKR